jgi:hypothetical protein
MISLTMETKTNGVDVSTPATEPKDRDIKDGAKSVVKYCNVYESAAKKEEINDMFEIDIRNT